MVSHNYKQLKEDHDLFICHSYFQNSSLPIASKQSELYISVACGGQRKVSGDLFHEFGPEFLNHALKGSRLTFVPLLKRDAKSYTHVQGIQCFDFSPGYKPVIFPDSHLKFAAYSEMEENTSRYSAKL